MTIDQTVVDKYFNGAGAASELSMVAGGYDLPKGAASYRIAEEKRILSPWLDGRGTVLDVGCGSGTWTKYFADKYSAGVMGLERSDAMVEAASYDLRKYKNAYVLKYDIRDELPPAMPFNLIFVGGVCMYLNDEDVVSLLGRLRRSLGVTGRIILRESTRQQTRFVDRGDYQVIYRSVDHYHDLFEQAGSWTVETERNWGYNALVMAQQLVYHRRKRWPKLPSRLAGAATWYGLRAVSPLTLKVFPRVLDEFELTWPKLQNHFFRLLPLQNS